MVIFFLLTKKLTSGSKKRGNPRNIVIKLLEWKIIEHHGILWNIMEYILEQFGKFFCPSKECVTKLFLPLPVGRKKKGIKAQKNRCVKIKEKLTHRKSPYYSRFPLMYTNLCTIPYFHFCM